jgi:hypothetical protein
MQSPKIQVHEAERIVHVHLDNCSINIVRTDEGILIDVWEPEFEGAQPVNSMYTRNSELV